MTMGEGFALSYGCLAALLIFEAWVLHGALRRAATLSRLYSAEEERQKQWASLQWHIPRGTRLPEFTAPLLGTQSIVTQADLEGRETILLFVSPADAASTDHHKHYHHIGPALGSMSKSVEGEVYLVCKGRQQDCERFVNGQKAIWDADGVLSRRFSINLTPRAVHLDEDGKVTRYGEPEHLDPLHQDHAEIAQAAHKGVGRG